MALNFALKWFTGKENEYPEVLAVKDKMLHRSPDITGAAFQLLGRYIRKEDHVPEVLQEGGEP